MGGFIQEFDLMMFIRSMMKRWFNVRSNSEVDKQLTINMKACKVGKVNNV